MDNAVQFQSREFHSFLNSYNVPFIFHTALYCPQVYLTEKFNSTIITALASLVGDDHRSWDKYLTKIQYAMNSATNVATGFTPNFLVFGRETIPCGSFYTPTQNLEELIFMPRDIYASNAGLLSSIFHKVQTKLHIAHAKNSARYDLRRSFKEFNVGDTVWRKNHVLSNASAYFNAKLAPKFIKCKLLKYKRRTGRLNENWKPSSQYGEGDLIAINRTQFGLGLKLKPKYLGPYQVSKVKRDDRYDVEKVDRAAEGPNKTSSSADQMKPWPD
ncbi:unnamed protein product [Parnassius mnemosyne]|uniref:Integrase catalytic domain-containing protein n=1 Tax=Parnassius mnemosyne TaxID=213953 RepID=A0AAV1LYY3_9NEOP